MTRYEAYIKTREEWEKEEKELVENSKFSFSSDAVRWSLLLDEIQGLLFNLRHKVVNLEDGIAKDRRAIRHFETDFYDAADADRSPEMASVDVDTAEEIAVALRDVINRIDTLYDMDN